MSLSPKPLELRLVNSIMPTQLARCGAQIATGALASGNERTGLTGEQRNLSLQLSSSGYWTRALRVSMLTRVSASLLTVGRPLGPFFHLSRPVWYAWKGIRVFFQSDDYDYATAMLFDQRRFCARGAIGRWGSWNGRGNLEALPSWAWLLVSGV